MISAALWEGLSIPGVYNGKGKTFFFFSEEFHFERTPTAYNQAIPSAAERSGNFSDVCPFVPPQMGAVRRPSHLHPR